MRLWSGVLFVFMMTFSVFPQTIDLNGKVSNSNGSPIKDAVVTLVGKGMADTTGSDGMYSLRKQVVSALSVFEIPQLEAITVRQGVVILSLPEAASMKIEIFDIMGSVIDRVERSKVSAGIYYFDILKKRNAPQMMVVRASIGSRVSTFQYMPMQQKLHLVNHKNLAVSGDNEALSKKLANIDSLEVLADGYETEVVTLASYQENNDIILDEASDLDPFSFFVTSYESLVKLSGSEDGFGGDLRYGETGQGAGLRGADKICETIAEMSMPGSKVKQWRAFLSVSADENGNQVNARDRIGTGPWYDRLGRLLSPTLIELLNERPMNGDPDIKNDLPNEYGIPNRYPDPTQPAVDNHHMVTGSDQEGRLYQGPAYTCQDWTSVAQSDKARHGLSWPRDYGGFRKVNQGGGGNGHWISSGNTSGCEAGTDLSGASIVGQPGVYTIGNGGGYGGFYCFALKP
jgi:hypothetical protein